MRVNPIRMGAFACQKGKMPYDERIKFNNNNFASGQDEVSFGSLDVSERELKKIIETIKDTDDARLDGSKLGLYKYTDSFMAKAPDSRIEDTAMKEFYALSRIHKFDSSSKAAPVPALLSKVDSDRHFLVEEFVPGKINVKEPFTIKQVLAAMDNLLTMDESGIISQDLSPMNTIYISGDRSVRFIDFDTFSYIGDSGRIRHSQSTPARLFETFLKNIGVESGEGRVLFRTTDVEESDRIKEMFAKSFTFKRRRPEGLHNLLAGTNISDNPFISVPSNVTNYESRTIFAKIMAGEVDNPQDFLSDYLQVKSRNYHSSMRDFLKTLVIPDTPYEVTAERYSIDEARLRLQSAIEYEDFLARLFEKKPDKYFAKLQAAKMQLNALMFHENLDARVPNYEQLSSAYNNLLDVISEGLYDCREPEYQRFLNAELDKYTEIFSHPDFSGARFKQPITDSLDILSAWFSDIGKDPKSFSVLRRSAKDAIKELMTALCRDLDDYNITPDQLKARYGALATSVSTGILEPIRDAFIDSQFDVENVKIVNEAIDEFARQDLKKLAEQAREEALRLLDESKGVVKSSTKAALSPKKIKEADARRLAHLSRHLPTPEAAIREHTKEYVRQKYVHQGGNMMLKALIGAAVIGFGVLQYFSYKKNQEKETTLTLNRKETKEDKAPVISAVTSAADSPFKQFMI